jgi:hypothetical protein
MSSSLFPDLRLPWLKLGHTDDFWPKLDAFWKRCTEVELAQLIRENIHRLH